MENLTADGVLDTGNGTGIDPTTLLGVIHDNAAFDAWDASGVDVFSSVIGFLFRGDTIGAQREWSQLPADVADFRRRGLLGDIRRDQGRIDDAIDIWFALLEESAGTPAEATAMQHLGKVHVVAGDLAAARMCFSLALQRRSDDPDVPTDQLASAQLALDRVDALLASPSADLPAGRPHSSP